ncbi:hypothetical protein V6N13_021799 [Hibiscus sabdariffa]|uniref:Uncharacterized protein n=1 Tax=Hibiscus sabdariffa TaxID=183260 RepID=A0ABR2CPP8_9ROSI
MDTTNEQGGDVDQGPKSQDPQCLVESALVADEVAVAAMEHWRKGTPSVFKKILNVPWSPLQWWMRWQWPPYTGAREHRRSSKRVPETKATTPRALSSCQS